MKTTIDGLLDGRVRYEQPRDGYRVSVEAPLLARFAVVGRARPFARAIDLGSGPGAIALMLCVSGWVERASAVELDAEHAELARRNARANGVALEVVNGAADTPLEAAELVITNPPYFEPTQGAVSPEPRRAASRAFVEGGFVSFARAARAAVVPRGRAVVAMPSSRVQEVLRELGACGLHAKRLRFVHPRPNREAQVVFIEARPTRPGGLAVEAPLFVRGSVGEAYTPEVDDTLRGRWIRKASATEERAEAGLPSARAGESDPE